ncbi:hypothetical protein OPV22_017003 [Ensete ventricosum]|uniref:Uncharacterized protein n=1 Tax=Ensete ventricosum TaxID=4639 RepID=A0AAV8R181_ENSVE|nr:hypothetical protein OPV22_017003 [Ensete ventricosum]
MLAPKRSARASRDGGVGRGWGWLRSRFAVGAFGRFRVAVIRGEGGGWRPRAGTLPIAGLKSVCQNVLKRGISCKHGCVPCSDVLDGPKQMHIMTWNSLSSTQRHTKNGELEV